MADRAQIEVRLNGKPRELEGEVSVRSLLELLELQPGMVVVELNHEIVVRDRYADVRLSDGDTIELVHFVGGG